MSYDGIRKQISALAELVPQGYATVDTQGAPAIRSSLAGMEWYSAAQNLLRSRGREKEKADLLWQLRISAGVDNGRGVLYQYLCAKVAGLMTEDELRKVARRAVLDRGCRARDVKRAVNVVLEGFIAQAKEK